MNGPMRYAKDPVLFLREVLDMDPDEWQEATAKDVQDHAKVAVKSGQGVGKTALEAGLCIWFLCCRPYAKVICTAPTMQQLYDVLWAEIAKWLQSSKVKDLLTWTKTKVYMNGDSERWFATAKTATKPENMQGFHEDHMLIIVDEASGVMDPIMEAILGTLTGVDNRLLLMGNPNRTEGVFYDAFNKDRERWKTRTVSSRESKRTSRDNIEMLESKYGKDSDVVRVRVDGLFPKGGILSFIPLEYAECCNDPVVVPDSNMLHVGVDVARFGDDKTVITKRRGMRVYPQLKYAKQSTMETAGRILKICRAWIADWTGRHPNMYDEYGSPVTGRCRVRIDDTGVGGGVTDRLREVVEDEELPIEVIPCNNSGKSMDAHYENAGAEMWGNVRELTEQNFSAKARGDEPVLQLPDDEELIKQLANRKYHLTSRGRIALEKKEDMKKRGLGSPDCADSLALCLYNPQVMEYNPVSGGI